MIDYAFDGDVKVFSRQMKKGKFRDVLGKHVLAEFYGQLLRYVSRIMRGDVGFAAQIRRESCYSRVAPPEREGSSGC